MASMRQVTRGTSGAEASTRVRSGPEKQKNAEAKMREPRQKRQWGLPTISAHDLGIGFATH